MNSRTIVAIDWSGAKNPSSQRNAIWLAQIQDGEFERVRPGFTRNEVVDELVALKERQPDVIVGLDFGFSFPAAALEELELEDAPPLWEWVAGGGADGWLDGADVSRDYPLEALVGTDGAFRQTERELIERFTWASPRSTIDLAARTGNVGRQSLRGFPSLHSLRKAGFKIWPFDSFEPPAVVEVYPRALRTFVGELDGDVGRDDVVRVLGDDPEVPHWTVELAVGDPNAFDAIVPALVMSRYPEPSPRGEDEIYRREGQIWVPG